MKPSVAGAKTWRFDGLARHLILSLILFSSLITALITAIDLYSDYKRDIGGIENRMRFIRESYLPTLVESVWVADKVQIDTQLEGLSRLQDIEYLAIGVAGQERWRAGALRSKRRIASDIPLLRNYRGRAVNIGTLHIVASVDNVMDRLWNKLLETLLRNLGKSFLVAVFMVFIFQRLAGRHLETIARHLRLLGREPHSAQVLRLDRPAQGRWRPDTLDDVVSAVNSMHQDIGRSHAEILALNAELEQRVAERTHDLERQNLRNELILDTTADGFFVVGLDGRILDVNPAYCRMLGYTRGELLQLMVPDVEANENAQEVAAHIAKILHDGHDRFDTRQRRKDGSLVAVEISVNLVALGDEKMFYAFVRDITERKQAEQALILTKNEAERANAAKSEFLSRMSHELRTPLNAVLGFGELLETDTAHRLTEEQNDHVREILHAGNHLLAMVNEVLDLSRIESGRLEVSLEPVALAPMIEMCVAQLRPLAAQRGIKVTLELEPNLLHTVQADRTRLKEVLLNLLSNAVKYNREGGAIDVRCTPLENKRLRISVHDTGHGIVADALPRLFQPFERLDSAYTGIQGTGIGLALSKILVEAMRGVIGVESVPGAGSTFWFELPLAEARESIPDAAAAIFAITPICASRHKILYIEDNPANMRLVQKIVTSREGIAFLEGVDGEAGLLIAIERQPDLILLDINLPGMDGFEVLRLLRENPVTRAIPVVAISANAMSRDIERGMEAGFSDYLTKPLEVQRLLSVVDRILRAGEYLN